MPELPEVETIVRTLSPHVLGSQIKTLHLLHPKTLHPLSLAPETLAGAAISSVRRRGKLAILELEAQTANAPACVIVHLRMTGRLLPKGERAKPGKHTRAIFELADGQNLYFDDIRTFGKILLANDGILQKWPFWTGLGPEPLELAPGGLAARLMGRRQLKAALLDQKVIAGIGNIYADEALFQARLNPMRLANTLTVTEAESLRLAIVDVLERAIAKCGSSIRDYRDADGNAGAFQKSFRVYGRGGKKCMRCGAVLQKCRVGGRATVFCPNCQPTST